MANLPPSGSRSPSPPVVGWQQIWGDQRFDLTRFLAIRPAACYWLPVGRCPVHNGDRRHNGGSFQYIFVHPGAEGCVSMLLQRPPLHTFSPCCNWSCHSLCLTPCDQFASPATNRSGIKLHQVMPRLPIREHWYDTAMHVAELCGTLNWTCKDSFVTKGPEQPKSHPDSVFGVGFNFACPNTNTSSASAGGPGSYDS